MARTLRDYFEQTTVRADGAPDLFSERRRRMVSLVIDGHPSGDYELGIAGTRQQWERFEESQWLALALVSCDADSEVLEFRSLEPRPGRATPAFQGTRRDGGITRIEVFRLVDRVEQQYLGALQYIAGGAEAIIEGVRSRNGINPTLTWPEPAVRA